MNIRSRSAVGKRIPAAAGVNPNEEVAMLSARNKFRGTVKSVTLGNVMAEVVVAVGSLEVVSVITRHSAEELKLQPGDAVTAVIKSTEVMLDK
jgi:molybdopterin-binding protein